MHSFLIIGKDLEKIGFEIQKLVKKLKVTLIKFELTKIDEVRELNSFTRLKTSKPLAILIKNIEKATTEAANAFLKNLEEPQENLKYILTASSEHKVLPTIVSRCQVIRIKNQESRIKNTKTVNIFLKSPIGERLSFIDKIRKRDEAMSFIESVIYKLHQLLISKPTNQTAHDLKLAKNTHLALSANGNIQLQLTNFVVNL